MRVRGIADLTGESATAEPTGQSGCTIIYTVYFVAVNHAEASRSESWVNFFSGGVCHGRVVQWEAIRDRWR